MLEKVWRKENPLHCWWECKLVQPLWKTVWRFFKILKVGVPWWLIKLRTWHCCCCGSGYFCGAGSIPGLGTCAQKKKLKIELPYVIQQSHFWVFIPRKGKRISNSIRNSQDIETTYGSIKGWMDEEGVVYIYTVEYYSCMRKKEILPFMTTWMDFKDIMLNEEFPP